MLPHAYRPLIREIRIALMNVLAWCTWSYEHAPTGSCVRRSYSSELTLIHDFVPLL